MTTEIIKLPKVETEITISPDWLAKRDELLARAREVKDIDDQESFEAGSELLRQITKTSNAMERFRKEYAEPYQEAVKLIKKGSDAARDKLERAKAFIQAKLNQYAALQAKREEEERRRIEEEQRKAVEEQLAQRAAAEAAAEDLGLDAPEPLPEPTVPDIPSTVERARSDAIRTQAVLVWNVEDEDKVPVVFKIIDPRKVNGWIAQNKDTVMKDAKAAGGSVMAIPGIRFAIETKVISR